MSFRNGRGFFTIVRRRGFGRKSKDFLGVLGGNQNISGGFGRKSKDFPEVLGGNQNIFRRFGEEIKRFPRGFGRKSKDFPEGSGRKSKGSMGNPSAYLWLRGRGPLHFCTEKACQRGAENREKPAARPNGKKYGPGRSESKGGAGGEEKARAAAVRYYSRHNTI